MSNPVHELKLTHDEAHSILRALDGHMTQLDREASKRVNRKTGEVTKTYDIDFQRCRWVYERLMKLVAPVDDAAIKEASHAVQKSNA